jgi:hypothetical protein
MKKMKALISFFFALFFTQGYSCAELDAADKLRISYSAVNATQAFLWVAQEKNFFAKHGLEGELLYINSGTMNIAALVGGSVQIAGGGPVSIEARLRGIKLTILGNPLPWLASNLVVHPDIKAIPDLAGKLAGISRFGSSTDQGLSLSVSQEQSKCRPRLEDAADGRRLEPCGRDESRHDPIHFSRRCGDGQCPRARLSRARDRAADGDTVSLDFRGRRRRLAQ